ncbi:MAG: hypothetical protein H5T91_04875 [Synergistetes bacterium]|nr:hypothetical protein [Synergistota bacterium]
MGKDETLAISAKKVVRTENVIDGEKIFLELRKGDSALLGVTGRRGTYYFDKLEAILEGNVRGKFGDLEWEALRMHWYVKLGEIVSEEGVRFTFKDGVGKSSKMVIRPTEGVVEFVGRVEISVLENK